MQKVKPYSVPLEARDTSRSATQKFDVLIGQRLRSCRLMMGISQEKLADAIGLTFQQVQKYEQGINRISASRLHCFSKILNVPIDFFYANLESSTDETCLQEGESEKYDTSPITNRETVELIRAYYQIEDIKVRKSILDLLKSVAKNNKSSATYE